jgi:hypothetical protein
MNQDRVPINEIGTRDEDEGAAPQAAHRQGLVIHPCASAYSDIHFFFDEIDRAIGGDDLHPDQRVVCQEAGHDPRKRVLGKVSSGSRRKFTPITPSNSSIIAYSAWLKMVGVRPST